MQSPLIPHPKSEYESSTQNADCIAGDFTLDSAVINALPPGTKVLCAKRFGISDFHTIVRISSLVSDGTHKDWFLKCREDNPEIGRITLEGEFHCMSEIYATHPSFVPKPHAVGIYDNSDTYFYIGEFIDMREQYMWSVSDPPPVGDAAHELPAKHPDPVALCSNLAKLHKASKSPTGYFGSQVPTCRGDMMLPTLWEPTWQKLFYKMFVSAMENDRQKNGVWDKLEEVFEKTLQQVIPQVLGPLESDGRCLKPSLIHGDMWEGNVAVDADGKMRIFDACAYYAHNEMEIGLWRSTSFRIINKPVYLEEYLRHMKISEPVEQFEDRLRLYNAQGTLITSALFGAVKAPQRQQLYDDLCFLVEKYCK